MTDRADFNCDPRDAFKPIDHKTPGATRLEPLGTCGRRTAYQGLRRSRSRPALNVTDENKMPSPVGSSTTPTRDTENHTADNTSNPIRGPVTGFWSLEERSNGQQEPAAL
ncbi:uncharacterized protein BDZ83DRAFT_647642 [Colletotrichum acutatum]|uniref:Uncharacterized protein n=1 Tax=Glomerella acutata TaxID=27357 RepID=A0AAD8XLR2_GLOAC|nr:uncharacterized protein BDZ83DRAFT_647642 [Colletotrichum acutatum]KAK1729705.1 hypothetical protein BDZ83DRAFT_647642 [Colletotrichum acutatum]